jgi:hypothetical protein
MALIKHQVVTDLDPPSQHVDCAIDHALAW